MGKVEDNEIVEEAAVRELQKETGFKTSELKLIGQFYQIHRRSDNIAYFFLVKQMEFVEYSPDKEEEITTKLLSKEQILQSIRAGVVIESDI